MVTSEVVGTTVEVVGTTVEVVVTTVEVVVTTVEVVGGGFEGMIEARGMVDAPVLFSTEAYADLAQRLYSACTRGRPDLGKIERSTFPDGERYLRLATPVAGKNVVVLGGSHTDKDTLELFDVACATRSHDARSVSLVIPYFGYSTMERAVHPGEVVTAKTRARLFSAIPGLSRVVLLDLHAEGIAHYFEGAIRPVHVYAKPLVLELARMFGGDDFVLGSTDAGRAKWVESLANDLGMQAAFVFKKRLDGARTELTAMAARVEGKPVVIYDDMIRTGGSLLQAARAYLAAGATHVSAIATHGVFPGDSLERLRASGVFSAIACTDSHPRARELAGETLVVASVADVLAKGLGWA